MHQDEATAKVILEGDAAAVLRRLTHAAGYGEIADFIVERLDAVGSGGLAEPRRSLGEDGLTKGERLVARMRGRGKKLYSADEIMTMTRSEV